MFCPQDNTLGCALCFVGTHTSCSNIAWVVDVSKDFKRSQEFRDIKETLDKQKESVNHTNEIIENCRAKSNTCHSTTIADYKRYMNKIEDFLEKN